MQVPLTESIRRKKWMWDYARPLEVIQISESSGVIHHWMYVVHPFPLSLTRDPLAKLHDLQELGNVTLSCCGKRDATA